MQEIQIEKIEDKQIQTHLTISPEIDKLVEALAKARETFDTVKKSTPNPFYKDQAGKPRMYADLSEIISATAIPLAKQGLVIFQAPFINDGKTVGIVTRLAHSSGQWVQSVISGCPADQKLKEGGSRFDAQTVGIGFTYLARYAERAMLNLGSEDDDGNGLVAQKDENKPIKTSSLSEPAKADPNLPTPLQLSNFGKQLKDLNQDSRLLKNYVEGKAGKSWKEIPTTILESIIKQLQQAEKDGTLIELIKPKA